MLCLRKIATQQVDCAENAGERRAQFVAHHSQEIRLRARRSFGGFDCGLQIYDLLSFGDVDDRGNHAASLGRLDWAEADFDGKLAAVATTPVEVAADAHKTRVRRANE